MLKWVINCAKIAIVVKYLFVNWNQFVSSVLQHEMFNHQYEWMNESKQYSYCVFIWEAISIPAATCHWANGIECKIDTIDCSSTLFVDCVVMQRFPFCNSFLWKRSPLMQINLRSRSRKSSRVMKLRIIMRKASWHNAHTQNRLRDFFFSVYENTWSARLSWNVNWIYEHWEQTSHWPT